MGKDELHHYVSKHLDSLYEETGEAFLEIIRRGDEERIAAQFFACKARYKKIEAAAEHFMPATARGINGAPLAEVEAEEHIENEPMGLQVVESYLIDAHTAENETELIRAVKNMHAMILRARQIWEVTETTRKQWMDAAYYEMLRIATLSISGFDSPTGKHCMEEAAVALQFVSRILQTITEINNSPANAAIQYLYAHPDFDAFDRAAFLRRYWQPAFAEVVRARQALTHSKQYGAVNESATGIFSPDFFRAAFFDGQRDSIAEDLAELGAALFADKRLSRNQKVSCASCHIPQNYFTDNLVASTGSSGRVLQRNTPSLINGAYQTSFFWDMRMPNLKMQAKAVIENHDEMHGSVKEVVNLLNKDSTLVQQFRKVYAKERSISENQVVEALAAFQRTLTSFESPFDAYMNGNATAVEQSAVKGFNLFMGKARCGTCHFPPTFSGLVPPYYDKMESEVLNVPSALYANLPDDDAGRYTIHPVPSYLNAFKTPTVRNVQYTFPYMHNGVFKTLDEVIDFYNNGGGAGMQMKVAYQTLPPDSLRLTNSEKKALIAFMHSLSAPVSKH